MFNSPNKSVGVINGIEEAPEDSKQYARQDGAWSEVASGGALLQTVNYNQQINTSTTSSGYVDTGISIGITPKSADSSVVYNIAVPVDGGGNTPMRLLINGNVITNSGKANTYVDTDNIIFAGVYDNTDTTAKTFTVQWYRAGTGSSTQRTPKIGGITAWGTGAPVWPHVNHTSGFLMEFSK